MKKNYCFYCEPEEFKYLKRCLKSYRSGQDNETDFRGKVDLANAKLEQVLDTLDYLITRDFRGLF